MFIQRVPVFPIPSNLIQGTAFSTFIVVVLHHTNLIAVIHSESFGTQAITSVMTKTTCTLAAQQKRIVDITVLGMSFFPN